MSSDDEELFPKKKQPRKAIVYADTLDQLNVEVQQKLDLPVAVRVLIFDDDFEEWIVPDDFEEVPEKGKVKISVNRKV